jgi:hypothetical protein
MSQCRQSFLQIVHSQAAACLPQISDHKLPKIDKGRHNTSTINLLSYGSLKLKICCYTQDYKQHNLSSFPKDVKIHLYILLTMCMYELCRENIKDCTFQHFEAFPSPQSCPLVLMTSATKMELSHFSS